MKKLFRKLSSTVIVLTVVCLLSGVLFASDTMGNSNNDVSATFELISMPTSEDGIMPMSMF